MVDPGPSYEVIERRVLAAGLSPVKPRREGAGAALAAGAGVAASIAVLAFAGVNASPGVVALALLFVLTGAAAILFAVRLGTPAAALNPWARRALEASPLVLLALAAFQRGHGLVWDLGAPSSPSCLLVGLLAAAPPVAAAAWVLAGGSPIVSWLAGALAGTGAGLLAGGMLHLHCPIGDLSHVVPFHGGVILVAALAAAAVNVAVWRARGRG